MAELKVGERVTIEAVEQDGCDVSVKEVED